MGFLDNIKDAVQDHLRPQDNRQDDYYEDEYDDYDEPYDGDADYYDDAQQRGDRYADRGQQQQGSGLLGNPSRPDADSISVYTRRVRSNQPVVLSFKNLKIEVAKRILDFSFGLACGIDGSVEELGDRVFVVLPQGVELSETDRAKLTREGLAR